MPFWRLSMDRAEIVVRAPIPVSRKLWLLNLLARQLVHSRRRLYRELLEVRS